MTIYIGIVSAVDMVLEAELDWLELEVGDPIVEGGLIWRISDILYGTPQKIWSCTY